MDFLTAIDTTLTQLLSPYWVRQEPFFTLFRFLSLEGNWVLVWATILILLYIWELVIHKNKNRFAHKIAPLVLSSVAVVLVLSVGIHWGFKPLIGRIRPFAVQNYPSMVCPHDFSFPSGHAAIAGALATLLIHFDYHRRRHALYILIAFLVSYSRIALQCHYLLDVLAGSLLGIGVSTCLKFAFVRYFPRFRDSSLPHKT